MTIHWRPATAEDIGMPCRFRDISDGPIFYGLLTGVGSSTGRYPFVRDGMQIYKFAEVAERERTQVEDPIQDVRDAVAGALMLWFPGARKNHKRITESAVERLPEYFWHPLYRKEN